MGWRNIFLLIALFFFISDVQSFWRRRRRRRRCHAVSCSWQWRSWSACSCATGTRTRSRYITRHPSCGGAACPILTPETQRCTHPNRRNCVKGWTGWSPCNCQGTKYRSTKTLQQPACGGAACPADRSESSRCIPVDRKNCVWMWSAWTACSCDGKRNRVTIIKQQAKCGGITCPPARKEANSCIPVDRKNCVWMWSAWTVCSCDGKQTRSMAIKQQPKCGGKACPPARTETNSCIPVDRKNCVWMWSAWTTCSCDGKQKRSTVIKQQTKCGGITCPPARTETNSCIPVDRKNCEWIWSNWTACSCDGRKFRRRIFQQLPKCGGTSCPRVIKTQMSCDKPKINCQLSWNSWSSCNCSGKRMRTMSTQVKPQCGGTKCPSNLTEYETCVSNDKKDCKWHWGRWSLCNCLQKRWRTLVITERNTCGGSACPKFNMQKKNCIWGSCVNGSGICNIRDGLCLCGSGKTGMRCELECPRGMFGLNCKQNCTCSPNVNCDPQTGKCCPHGRTGRGCQKEIKGVIKGVDVDIGIWD